MGIVIPRAYLDYWRINGKKIKEFNLEINNNMITLEPLFENEKTPQQKKPQPRGGNG